MKIRKFIAVMIAAVMCFSLSAVAFAVNGEEESTQENVTSENTTAEESTSEEVSEESAPEENPTENPPEEESTEAPTEESTEAPSEEESTEAPSEEESTQAPDEEDVISLIISLLGKIDFEELKDAFNEINEALGLPKIENFTDIPAYADALYEKLEEMGLGYGDIINGLASSDLLDWLNKLIFGGGNSSAPSTTVPSDDIFEELPDENPEWDSDYEGTPIPDTGVSFGVVAAAVAAMGGSGALAFVLRKRNSDEE